MAHGWLGSRCVLRFSWCVEFKAVRAAGQPLELPICVVFFLKVPMNNIRSRLGARASAALVTLMLVNQAMAQAADPLTAALDSVDLSGLVTKIAAAGLVIVAIALAFKGPALAKRVVSKV